MSNKGGRPKGSKARKYWEDTLQRSAGQKYLEALRYFVVVEGWQTRLTAQGVPARHLGRYINQEAAVASLRQVHLWLPHVGVWDQRELKIVTRLDAELAPDDQPAEGVIEFYVMDDLGEVALHTFYPVQEFVQLLLADLLP